MNGIRTTTCQSLHQNIKQFRPRLRPVPMSDGRHSIRNTDTNSPNWLTQSDGQQASNVDFCLCRITIKLPTLLYKAFQQFCEILLFHQQSVATYCPFYNYFNKEPFLQRSNNIMDIGTTQVFCAHKSTSLQYRLSYSVTLRNSTSILAAAANTTNITVTIFLVFVKRPIFQKITPS